MSRHKGIIAYGTEQDRLKLAVLAKLSHQSGSEFLIEIIRSKFAEAFGDTDPNIIMANQV